MANVIKLKLSKKGVGGTPQLALSTPTPTQAASQPILPLAASSSGGGSGMPIVTPTTQPQRPTTNNIRSSSPATITTTAGGGSSSGSSGSVNVNVSTIGSGPPLLEEDRSLSYNQQRKLARRPKSILVWDPSIHYISYQPTYPFHSYQSIPAIHSSSILHHHSYWCPLVRISCVLWIRLFFNICIMILLHVSLYFGNYYAYHYYYYYYYSFHLPIAISSILTIPSS
jgi:hypothetical protein